jgi:hypothetical protein
MDNMIQKKAHELKTDLFPLSSTLFLVVPWCPQRLAPGHQNPWIPRSKPSHKIA